MSLVGTRPPTLDEWEKYEPHHRARMSFRPGLTGLWQVSGRSNITDFEEVVKLDTQYIGEWSVKVCKDELDKCSMKKEKYDVIHVNGQSATMSVEMLAAKLAGCKLRVAHSHNSRCLHKKAHNMLKPLFNATYNDAIACSKEAGDWLFGDKPYWILNNGIDIDKYKFSTTTRTEFRKKLKLSDKDIAVYEA